MENDVIMARSVTLFLMILFQNFQLFNARSETKSVFNKNFFNNPFLFISITIVTLIHIVASYMPVFDKFLNIDPLGWTELAIVLPTSFMILAVMELEKVLRR